MPLEPRTTDIALVDPSLLSELGLPIFNNTTLCPVHTEPERVLPSTRIAQLQLHEKSRVQYRDIPRPEKEPLRWIHITHPNEATLLSVSEFFAVKYGDLKPCLSPICGPRSYRYGDYLVNRFVELSLSPTDPLRVIENGTLGILGEDFLVTVSDGPSANFTRVWDELESGSVSPTEVGSSNHLFSRLFGSALHLNSEVTHTLEMRCQDFLQAASREGPSRERRKEYRLLSEGLLDARRALENNPEVLYSLKEDRNLFGSPAPRNALDRYSVIQSVILTRLDQSKEFVKLAHEDWKVTQTEHQNSILYRLALLSGALSPIALTSSLFGMNFPNGLPYSSLLMWGCLAASIAVSAGLVGALGIRGAFPKRYDRGQEEL